MKIIRDDFPPFIKKWLSLLKLNDDNFIFYCEEEHDNVFDWDRIKYIPNEQTFRIQIKYPNRRFSIVHELGHLYLAKQVNNIKLVVSANPDSNLMDIRVLLYGMMDGFVNYNLIKFEEFYEYFLETHQIGKFLYLHDETQKDFSFFEVLDKFIMLIIEYEHIIKNPDRVLRIEGRNKSFKFFRELVLKKAREENIRFSYQKIQSLQNSLKRFSLIKDSLSFNIILNFMFMILKKLKLWDEKDIKKLFQQMFSKNSR